MDIQIQDNGDLILQTTAEERDDLYSINESDRMSAVYDLFEPYSCNGSYTLFDAGDGNPFVGLTNAPCIAESVSIDDDGKRWIEGRLWSFPDYQIKDFVDGLIMFGQVVFTQVK